MKLDLEVLAFTNIKRKKPWPKIIWIGEEQESLLLLDPQSHRISVLYVPSGKTKRQIPRLSPLINEIHCFSFTKNRCFLLGLLWTGNLFVWYKDKDILKHIQGPPNVADQSDWLSDQCALAASDDLKHVFLVLGTSQFFIWEMNKGESLVRSREQELKGTWHELGVPSGVPVPTADNRECSFDVVFFSSQVLGECCQYSSVFNQGRMLKMVTVLIRFNQAANAQSKSNQVFSKEWSLLEYPFLQIHPKYEPILSKGAYVCSYSGNGQILAVAANQNQADHTSLLFVSPLTDTVLATGMKRCGVKDSSAWGRQVWVADLAWTSDSLFVACILKSGSVCIISRLGEPVVIKAEGCTVNMGPSYYLPLHPALMISGYDGIAGRKDQDPMGQQFSVSTHPSLPIILFSDGFVVTLVQLPADMTCTILMRDLVLESTRHLCKITEQENLDISLADAYKLSKSKGKNKARKNFVFEDNKNLNATQDSEASIIEEDEKFSHLGILDNLDAGQIVFGQPELVPVNLDKTFTGLNASESLLKHLEEAQASLFAAWKLAASFADTWTSDVDNIAKQTTNNITKVFTVILDCPAVDAAIMPHQSSTIQNPRVYNVLSAYKQYLQILRFDLVNQHLLPIILRLVHRTVNLMLMSKELERIDPRLKTLLGCYSILKHARSVLNRIYTWVPAANESMALPQNVPVQANGSKRFEPAVLTKVQRYTGNNIADGVNLDSQGHLPGRRLCATWQLLYKHLLRHKKSLGESLNIDPRELDQLNKLIFSVQETLQEVDGEITPSRATKVTSGDKLSVDGEHTLAVEAWKEQLKNFTDKNGNDPKVAHTLHSVLYTYLLKGDLAKAVEFVDSLILQANVRRALSAEDLPEFEAGVKPALMTLVTHTLRSQNSEEEELVPCIRNKAIRQVVQSMARFMASYFSNQTLFIYPPHNAQALPSIHMGDTSVNNRIIPKYHEDITKIITRDGLSSVWTTERTVEYLLLSGLVCEMAWFAHKLGDWKTAFLLAFAHHNHKEIAPHVYKRAKKPLQLPASLSPESILQGKLQALVSSNQGNGIVPPASPTRKQNKRYFIPITEETNFSQLTNTLENILTTGLVCGVELAPWLLDSLVDKVKAIVANFPPLVPQDFYLPAPPLYCPQPAEVDTRISPPEVEFEKQLRMEVSSLIQLILVVLNSTHLSLPLARWYIQELAKVQEKAAQFKATTEGPCMELPEVLQQYKIFQSSVVNFKESVNVTKLMGSFRDICTILWLLHVRDKLSQHIRQRGKKMISKEELHRDNSAHMSQESAGASQEGVQECFTTLQWAVHMLAFSKYLLDEDCLHKVVLSLILELPATEDTADILAEYFHDMENLEPEVQEKLDRLLNNWKSVETVPETHGIATKVQENGEAVEGEGDGEVRKSVTFFQASPRTIALSVYFHKQCEVVPKVFKRKRKCFGNYEEFVFNSKDEIEGTVHSSISFQYINGILVGSRPFETKQSFMEFLDTLFAISFTKIVQEESRQGRNVKYPLILPFASDIKEKEFQSYPLKNLDGSQKRHTSVVKSSPRAKFLRSQSESHAFEEEEKPTQKNVKPRGLFRSNSSGDVIPSSIKSSRTSLADTENSPGREGKLRAGNSPTKAQTPNMTGLASKYYQSEEVLYRDPAESDDGHWVLDVNFGHHYLSLQRVLDWLYQWGSHHHALGLHWKGEKDLALRPTMRIEVPTQLVVLSLWLLEHKYSSAKRKKGSAGASTNADKQPMTQQYVDGTERKARSKALSTLEELTENDSFQNASDLRKSANSGKGKEERSKRSMVTEDSLLSVNSVQMEDEETARVQTAYKHVLNGVDDSSSLEVSSLGSEDMDEQTLSLIKGFRSSHKKPRKVSPSKESPDRRDSSTLNNTHFQSSPERKRMSNMVPNSSTPIANEMKRKSRRTEFEEELNGEKNILELSYTSSLQRSRVKVGGKPGRLHGNNPEYHDYADNPDHRHQENPGDNIGHHNRNRSGHHHQSNPGHSSGNPARNRSGNAGNHHDSDLSHNPGNNNGPGSMSGLDIGQQLKYIIRGELRRMLEVQHQSMMAMMGALDETRTPWQPDQPANETIEQHLSRSQPDRTRGPMVEDELEHSQRPHHQKPNVREVLQEMKNLQKESLVENVPGIKGKRLKSPHGKISGKENILEASLHVSDLQSASRSPQEIQLYQIRDGQEDVNLIPRFLRIPAEKDDGGVSLKLPKLPQEAWGQEKNEKPREEISRIPLLQIDENAHKIAHIPYQYAPSRLLPMPQAGYFNGDITNKAVHISVGHHDIPLLQLPKDNEQQGKSTFGKLLPPSMVGSQQQTQAEALRERMAKEFQEFLTYQAAQDEEMERQRFGGKLLHINFERVKAAEDEMERQMEVSARAQQRAMVPVETIPQKNNISKPTAPRRKKVLVISPGRTEKQVDGEAREAKAREENDETAGEEVSLEQNEEEEVKEEEASEEEGDGEIHDGYAIRPGTFENYLELEKELLGGAPMDTHARLQYLTAMKLQQQRRKRQKVDFSTMTRELIDAGIETDFAMETESVRTAEAATSITKDTGVDPIQEAVIEYNRSRQGNALPPDIYMGLRFTNGETQPATAGQGAARGRSYINVVDLDASAVMKDIEARPETEETPADELGLRPTAIMDRSLLGRDYETNLRDSYEQNIPSITRPTREDAVTIRMFETKAGGHDSVSVAIMPRGSLPESKAAVIRHLREMNQQIAAMDQMSENMVKEFKNTRLMLHTLETLDEAMKHEENVQGEFGSEEEEEDQRTSSVKTGSLKESSLTDTLTPKQSQKSPTISARGSARTKKSVTIREDQNRRSDETRVSGLSGISDIIGEMVAQGDIDLEEAGLTNAEAQRLVKKSSLSQRVEQEEVAPVKLQRKPLPGMREHKYDPEDLKEWISAKRAERMGQYKQQLGELREREIKPYKPRSDAFDKTLSGRELEAEKNARQQSRKYLEKENLARRMLDAEDLLGDIISDKPKLPEEPPPRIYKKKASRPKKDLSPSRTRTLERDFSPELQKPIHKKKSALKPQDYNVPSAELYSEEEDEYMMERDMYLSSTEISPVRSEMGHKPILVQEYNPNQITQELKKPIVPKMKQSLKSVEEEAETTDDLKEYTRAVQAMDVSESQEIAMKVIEKPKKPYKPKSFTELVRLQRPEITKKGRHSQIPVATEELYTGRTITVSPPETPTPKEMTEREKMRIYGSKHLPGSRPIVDPSTRRVKTYAERLQEMKSTVTYSTPVAPRIHVVGSSVTSESARSSGLVRKSVKPKHKPLTYVERLQKLSEGTHKPRAGHTEVVQRPVMRSHKPIHKPQTYTQQLKALQAPKQPPRAVSRAKKLSAARTAARPYRDPYKEHVKDLDDSSVVSSWSMGDDVRKILYEDDISSIGRGTSYGRMSMASEQISDYYNVVMGEDYSQSVDIDEIARIADAASVSSGSVMSIIDWDAVDNLIADVR
ncbi:hypothetical protein CHS0354_022119 [Potamilus streckersoni]|uniref:Protein JBTS17 n=1 Tax=Potamilus streckersoni TaxID=2493646 RepID=A0AAE0RT51_9BIVA|nr:hypothetical protein CHS0354_022119 [Potamilus streckersoni]